MFKALLLTTIFVIAPFVVSAAIIHVPADQPTIQAGIDAAVDGDTVLVADGTYTGDGNRDIDFKGKAITVTSENGAETCIIDCQEIYGHRGFYFHTNETLLSILQSFTIINGSPSGDQEGGGIYCTESSPTIRDCVISGNEATVGLGIYCSFSSLIITNCVISNNSFHGSIIPLGRGGIACIDSSPTITHCAILANLASPFNDSGGIYCVRSTSVIYDCAIFDNKGAHSGGGFYCYDSSVSISNCTFSLNEANYEGGGVYCSDSYLKINNSVFSLNKATKGGGIFFENSSVILNNSVFSFNLQRGVYSWRSNIEATNCIFWENSLSQILLALARQTHISYSNIQGGFPGIGNINVDPLFVGGDPFDYHLSSNSPCIDAGTDSDVSATDLDGFARQQGGAVDIGAYESSGWPLETRAYIKMPSHHFHPGDKASCIGSVWNPHEFVFDEYLFFAVLDIWGTFYCAPSYNMIDYYFQDCNPGLTEIQIMPEFIWPSGVGSVSGIVWYAGLVNPEMTELVSEIGVFDFGWSE